MMFFIALPLCGAAAVPFLKGRKVLGLWASCVSAVTLCALLWASFAGLLTGMSALYGCLTAFMWLGSSLLSPQYFRHPRHLNRYYFFFLLVFAATVGVFLAKDLYTMFLFFELMSLGSYVWVVHEETPGAVSAGRTYLTISVLGGLVTLMGLLLLYHLTGTLTLSSLGAACAAVENRTALHWASLLFFFGFAAKAGAFPVHIWLPKAHPVAPAPASALLSGVLTKTGIYGAVLITVRLLPEVKAWGILLLVLGTVTMVLGAGMAVMSSNLKTVLACSSLSQIGFILVGTSMISLLGEHNTLAAHGTVLYMVNHSLVKLALFLLAGVVYLNLHALELNEIRGFGRGKPWLLAVYLCGGLSLAGVPGFCGYISKTLVHEAIVEYAHLSGQWGITLVEWLFLFSGGLTAAYVLKVGMALFTGGERRRCDWGTPATRWAVSLPASALLLLGLLPRRTAERLMSVGASFAGARSPLPEIHYLSGENLKGVAISLTIGVLVYVLFIRRVLYREGKHATVLLFSLEERVYLPVLRKLSRSLLLPARMVCDSLDALLLLLRRTVLRPVKPRVKQQTFGALARALAQRRSYDEREAADRLHTVREVWSRMSRGFAFSLLMTCWGLCTVLVVILLSIR